MSKEQKKNKRSHQIEDTYKEMEVIKNHIETLQLKSTVINMKIRGQSQWQTEKAEENTKWTWKQFIEMINFEKQKENEQSLFETCKVQAESLNIWMMGISEAGEKGRDRISEEIMAENLSSLMKQSVPPISSMNSK